MEDVGFLVESEVFEKFKLKIMKVVFMIRRVILEGRLIFLRYYVDVDGYIFGLVFEYVIVFFIEKILLDL